MLASRDSLVDRLAQRIGRLGALLQPRHKGLEQMRRQDRILIEHTAQSHANAQFARDRGKVQIVAVLCAPREGVSLTSPYVS
jgi:hypothetical protein